MKTVMMNVYNGCNDFKIKVVIGNLLLYSMLAACEAAQQCEF